MPNSSPDVDVMEVYVNMSEPLDPDPDSTNICVFRDSDGRCYRVDPLAVHRQAGAPPGEAWEIRSVVRKIIGDREVMIPFEEDEE